MTETTATIGARPLRILFVEDSTDDLALLVRNLRKAGYDPSWEQVEDEDNFRRALLTREWDVVLADYSLPKYSAADAILHLRELRPYLPMIVVSGNVGEETAVAVVKAGAGDYVMKDSLARLAPAIDREIREALDRKLRDEQTDRTLHLSSVAVRQAPVGLLLVNSMGEVAFANPRACELLAASIEEIIGARMSDIVGGPWDSGPCDVLTPMPEGGQLRLNCGQASQGFTCCLIEPAPFS